MFDVIIKSHKKYGAIYGTYPTRAEAEQVANTLPKKRWQEVFVKETQPILYYDKTTHTSVKVWGNREFL